MKKNKKGLIFLGIVIILVVVIIFLNKSPSTNNVLSTLDKNKIQSQREELIKSYGEKVVNKLDDSLVAALSLNKKQGTSQIGIIIRTNNKEEVYNPTYISKYTNIVFANQTYGQIINEAGKDSVSKVWLEPEFKTNLWKSVSSVNALNSVSNGYFGSGVKVCVNDGGIDFNNPYLHFTKTNQRQPPDSNDHGTHVSGIIANTNSVYHGFAPNVELYGFDSGSGRSILNGYEGLEWCLEQGADIITNSWGSDAYITDTCEDNWIADFVNVANSKNVIVVFSAGNSGIGGCGAPGCYPGVVSVAAVDVNGQVAGFSSRCNAVDIAAPGVNVMSTIKNANWASYSGTSMAAPSLTGSLAILKSLKPSVTKDELLNAVFSTAKCKVGNCPTNTYGHGVVDVEAACEALGISNCQDKFEIVDRSSLNYPPMSCEQPVTCSYYNYNCGIFTDPCSSESIDCGICSSGTFCKNNKCCSESTCASKGFNCGSYVDACTGNTISCGGCSGNLLCGGNKCYDPTNTVLFRGDYPYEDSSNLYQFQLFENGRMQEYRQELEFSVPAVNCLDATNPYGTWFKEMTIPELPHDFTGQPMRLFKYDIFSWFNIQVNRPQKYAVCYEGSSNNNVYIRLYSAVKPGYEALPTQIGPLNNGKEIITSPLCISKCSLDNYVCSGMRYGDGCGNNICIGKRECNFESFCNDLNPGGVNGQVCKNEQYQSSTGILECTGNYLPDNPSLGNCCTNPSEQCFDEKYKTVQGDNICVGEGRFFCDGGYDTFNCHCVNADKNCKNQNYTDSCGINICNDGTLNCGTSCVPSCSCSVNTCIGLTCLDGCGGICQGTKTCTCTPTNPSCAANTCIGSTCNDGCNNIPGTKVCNTESNETIMRTKISSWKSGSATQEELDKAIQDWVNEIDKPICYPSDSCKINTCIDSTCSDGCGGLISGTKDCSDCFCPYLGNTCVGRTDHDSCGNLRCKGTKTCGQISTCGNSIKEGTEVCDGTDFGGKTCATYGDSNGYLICDDGCLRILNGMCY